MASGRQRGQKRRISTTDEGLTVRPALPAPHLEQPALEAQQVRPALRPFLGARPANKRSRPRSLGQARLDQGAGDEVLVDQRPPAERDAEARAAPPRRRARMVSTRRPPGEADAVGAGRLQPGLPVLAGRDDDGSARPGADRAAPSVTEDTARDRPGCTPARSSRRTAAPGQAAPARGSCGWRSRSRRPESRPGGARYRR